jgi:hypothetical protein
MRIPFWLREDLRLDHNAGLSEAERDARGDVVHGRWITGWPATIAARRTPGNALAVLEPDRATGSVPEPGVLQAAVGLVSPAFRDGLLRTPPSGERKHSRHSSGWPSALLP